MTPPIPSWRRSLVWSAPAGCDGDVRARPSSPTATPVDPAPTVDNEPSVDGKTPAEVAPSVDAADTDRHSSDLSDTCCHAATSTRPAQLTGPPGRVIEVEKAGPSVAILRFGKPAGFSFTAGQYMRVGLTNVRQGKFTIASAPHDSYLEICVESIPGGRLTPRLVALGPGASLEASTSAKGSFVLDNSGDTHVMVATGTGIAPFISMVRDALHRGLGGSFVILHGASHADDLPYRDELTALAASNPNVEYIPTVSRPDEAPNAGWTGRTGRVDVVASEMAPQWAGPATRVYACGNGGMVKAVTGNMRSLGLKVTSETFD